MNIDDFNLIPNAYVSIGSKVCFKNIDDYCLNIVLGAACGINFSMPIDINLDINKYSYVRFYISKSRFAPSAFETFPASNMSDMELKFGINLFNLQKSGDFCYDVVKISELESIYYKMICCTNKVEQEDKAEPCCVCKLNDKWNSKQNNKWFCYQHCSY